MFASLTSTSEAFAARTRPGVRVAQIALCAALVMGVLGWIATTALTRTKSAAVTPKADYRLHGTLASSVGSPPALTDLGPGTNAFATETVEGSPRAVLTFPYDNGVQLAPTAGVVHNDTYTIAVLFRFATVTGGQGWERIVDFKDGTNDHGLYVYNGVLELYPYARGTTPVIHAEEYVQVVLTRDFAGTVVGYVDGTRQFSFNDSVRGDAVIDASDTLRFFRDNETGVTPGEASSGAVARIQLYDQALNARQIAALSGGLAIEGTGKREHQEPVVSARAVHGDL